LANEFSAKLSQINWNDFSGIRRGKRDFAFVVILIDKGRIPEKSFQLI
jgi:hypothetical protein